MLIGELLGPVEERERTDLSPARDSERAISKDDRHRFRLLAAHAERVEELLARGVTARRALLACIVQPADDRDPGAAKGYRSL